MSIPGSNLIHCEPQHFLIRRFREVALVEKVEQFCAFIVIEEKPLTIEKF